MNYFGKGSVYFIIDQGKKIVYIIDNELYLLYKKEIDFLIFVEFVWDVDLIIYDVQYMIFDMLVKSGWGYLVVEEVVKLVMVCNVKCLVLYSYDLCRIDDDIDVIVFYCNQFIVVVELLLEMFVVYEGFIIDFCE